MTQFVEFIRRISTELEKKGVKIAPQDLTTLAQKYKENPTTEIFLAIIAYLTKK